MTIRVRDIRNTKAASGSGRIEPVPYSSRGAGLYSEVYWNPSGSLRPAGERVRSEADRPRTLT